MRLVCMLIVAGCASERAAEVEDPACCREVSEPPSRGIDFAQAVNGPARCEADARALQPSDEAWRALGTCVNSGHFTALRELLSGAWDADLKTRPDAPLLLMRVIAARGGNVDSDLALLHERRIPLFSLSQALARPDLYQGTFLIVRAAISPSGVLEELRLVGRTDRRIWWRHGSNLEVRSGQRVLASADPFIDGDPEVLLARFDGLRESDGWPAVSVLAHTRPGATLIH